MTGTSGGILNKWEKHSKILSNLIKLQGTSPTPKNGDLLVQTNWQKIDAINMSSKEKNPKYTIGMYWLGMFSQLMEWEMAAWPTRELHTPYGVQLWPTEYKRRLLPNVTP